MTYLSDRDRIEFALIPNIMLGILVVGVNDRSLPDAKRCEDLLRSASFAPFDDLALPDQAKLVRRTRRIHDAIMQPYMQAEISTAKAGLIVFYLLSEIVDSGYLVIANDSDLSEALDIFLPAIEHAAQIQGVDRSAQKQARRILNELQNTHKLYRGVSAQKDEAA